MSSLGRPRRSTPNDAGPGTQPLVAAAPTTAAAGGSPSAMPGPSKRARYALWKNPEHLTVHQRRQLEWIEKTDPRLWRAYLLKEGLRYAVTAKSEEGKIALDHWISWARRSRLPAFVELARKVTAARGVIEAAMDSTLSNALIESTNTKIRLLTRIAFGFHGPEPLIALAMLALGGHRPDLPGRN